MKTKMPESSDATGLTHDHVFLARGHDASERRTWAVIWLCSAMMLGEIVGGSLFGSIALVADGLHMSTHAGALLLAALAYAYSRRHADDPRFSFGTGKLGDLAGFTSAVVLAMIALLIGYEAVVRLFHPLPIHFAEAIPIAALGLGVNIASVWLLSAGGHHHHAGHSHGHGHDDHEPADDDEGKSLATSHGRFLLSVFEDGEPPRFRLVRVDGAPIEAAVTVETIRPDGAAQLFSFERRDDFLQSVEEIPEPHAFIARTTIGDESEPVAFTEHEHGGHSRDNNMRAAIVHVVADAAVSLLVIVGLVLARLFGWLWMDPLAGIVGACVIGSWSYGLIRDTGSILLDMNPDRQLTDQIAQVVKASGDKVTDLHLWRLGPGHLGAILSVETASQRDDTYYRNRLAQFRSLSHLTVELVRRQAA